MTPSHRILASVMLAVALPCGSLLADTPAEARERAVSEFVERVHRIRIEREAEAQAQGTPVESLLAALVENLKSTVIQLRPLMPEILDTLGNWQTRRSPDEAEVELVESMKRPSDFDMRSMEAALERLEGADEMPRCQIAIVIGELGREAPDMAVPILLNSIPLPERADDECAGHALATLGPSAYPALAKRLLAERLYERVFIGTLALVGQAPETVFMEKAGLGSKETGIETFPSSRRGLKRLVRKFSDWWEAEGNGYTWNSGTLMLERTE